MYKVISIFFLVFSLSHSMFGQINVKIGYNAGYTSGGDYENLLNAYNSSNPFLEKEIGKPTIMHGIELGLRYRWESIGVEFIYNSMGTSSLSAGEDTDGSLHERELFYRLNNFMLGVETYFGNRGVGISAGIRSSAIKTGINGSEIKNVLASDNQWVSRIYWIINHRGNDFIGLSLKPYLEIPLSSFLLSEDGDYELHDYLEEPVTNQNMSTRFPIFGVSIQFYNGWQADY